MITSLLPMILERRQTAPSSLLDDEDAEKGYLAAREFYHPDANALPEWNYMMPMASMNFPLLRIH